MGWSSEMSEGFLLAATLATDRHAARGRTRLGAVACAEFDAWMQANAGSSDAERRQRIKTISQRISAPITMVSPALPDRALALLSPLAKRSLGEQWLRQAPPPRTGFQADPGLRRVLATIAERGTWHA